VKPGGLPSASFKIKLQLYVACGVYCNTGGHWGNSASQSPLKVKSIPARLIGLSVASLLVTLHSVPAQEEPELEPEPTGTSIIDRSPFIPAGWTPPRSNRKAATRVAQSGNYEFRGVYQLGGKYRFLVSEPKSRDGSWVELDTAYEDYEVKGYDADSMTLTLNIGGRSQELVLADLEANPTPMPVSGQVRQAAPATANGTANKPPQQVRRTVRPSRTTAENTNAQSNDRPPPPQWLQDLRQRVADRRSSGEDNTGQNIAGSIGGSGRQGPPGPPPDFEPPTPPPDFTPPPPPSDLSVPEPPPEIMRQIENSLTGAGTSP
jgi:hypothetical protein